MAKTPEAKERDPTVAFARKLGIKSIRMYFGPGIRTGWPDDLFLIPGGRPLFLEAKARGKELTKQQEKRKKELEEDGYDVGWYDNQHEAREAITRALERALLSGEGERLSCEPGSCGFVPRPRIRQDLNHARRLLQIERGRRSKKDAGHRPAPRRATRVEAGGETLDTVQAPKVRNAPRAKQGRYAKCQRRHLFD